MKTRYKTLNMDLLLLVWGSWHLTYKKTRDGDTIIDKVVQKVMVDSGDKYNIVDFFHLEVTKDNFHHLDLIFQWAH